MHSIVFRLTVAFFVGLSLLLAGCGSATKQAESMQSVKSWLEQDTPISVQEKELIQVVGGFARAHNNNDFAEYQKWYVRGKEKKAAFDDMVSKTKQMKLIAVEVTGFNSNTIQGRVLLSVELMAVKPNEPTTFLSQLDAVLTQNDGRWMIKEIAVNKENSKNTFKLFAILPKAALRYGTENLAKWDQQAQMKSASSWSKAESNVPISVQEKDVVRSYVEIVKAMNSRDFESFAKRNSMPYIPWEKQKGAFLQELETTRNVKLASVEVVSYSANIMHAVVIYSSDKLASQVIGTTRNYLHENVYFANRNGEWVVISAEPFRYVEVKTNADNAKNIALMFAQLEKAKKRYGTDDLSKWTGLKS